MLTAQEGVVRQWLDRLGLPKSLAWREMLALSAMLGLLALMSVVAGCGQTTIVCPPGFLIAGPNCVCPIGQHPEVDSTGAPACAPDAPPSTGKDAGSTAKDASSGLDAAEPADALVVDASVDAAKTDTGPTDGSATDAKPDSGKADVAAKPKVVGAACLDDFDCASGFACYAWPKGYCTLIQCNSPGVTCPGSATCWQPDANTSLCAGACAVDADCRSTDGYACKRLSATFGNIDGNLCLPSGKAKPGAACAKALDCAGSATCLTDMPGGYCARIGCGVDDPCETGTACVLRNGKPTCLKTCSSDTDCAVTGQKRKCVDKTDLGKQAVQVCLDTTKSAPVGSPCVTDLDCDSKLCSIYQKGSCADGKPCLVDGNCGSNGPCKADAAAEKGVCGQSCGTDKACPLASACVPTTVDGTSGACQPACKGPGDDATCSLVPGQACVYGTPVPPPATPALPGYWCALRPDGSAGADCATSDDCADQNCLVNKAGTAGFCTTSCGSGSPCPFGSLCVKTGVSQCWRTCSLDLDCPTGMTCKANSQSGGTKICTP
jgi:hypothetical protein